MVRSSHLERQRQRQREEQEAAAQADLASRRNDSFATRLGHLAGRGFVIERGINVAGLESTTIPGTIAARNWGHFTRAREPYHPGLVREFYAAMVPAVFRDLGRVWVQGVPLEITSTAINEYLHTPTLPEEDYSEGFPVAAQYAPELSEMAAALRHDHSDMWIPGTTDLYHGELSPDVAFWSVFISQGIITSTHRTKVGIDTARLLYAIQTDVPFDVGHFICASILRTGCHTQCLLGFPCLITYFCRRAGIAAAFDETVLEAPQTDICRKSYNSFCSRHGHPNIAVGGRYRNRGRLAAAQHQAPPVQEATAPPPPVDADPNIRERIEEIHSRVIDHGHILHRLQHTLVPPSQQAPFNVYHRRHRGDGAGPSS